MINVDSGALTDLAATVRSHDGNIARAFEAPLAAMRDMDAAWNGSASENAVSAFYRIRDEYCNARSHVLQGFAKVLDSLAAGYNATEFTNTSLADRFL